MSEKKEMVILRAEPELHAAIRAAAARENRTVSCFLRHIAREYFAAVYAAAEADQRRAS